MVCEFIHPIHLEAGSQGAARRDYLGSPNFLAQHMSASLHDKNCDIKYLSSSGRAKGVGGYDGNNVLTVVPGLQVPHSRYYPREYECPSCPAESFL